MERGQLGEQNWLVNQLDRLMSAKKNKLAEIEGLTEEIEMATSLLDVLKSSQLSGRSTIDHGRQFGPSIPDCNKSHREWPGMAEARQQTQPYSLCSNPNILRRTDPNHSAGCQSATGITAVAPPPHFGHSSAVGHQPGRVVSGDTSFAPVGGNNLLSMLNPNSNIGNVEYAPTSQVYERGRTTQDAGRQNRRENPQHGSYVDYLYPNT